MLNVRLHRKATKQLKKLPENTQRQIIDSLSSLEKSGHPLKCKNVIKLSGRKGQDFRMRVGDYRIKFTLDIRSTVLVTRVEHRQAGY